MEIQHQATDALEEARRLAVELQKKQKETDALFNQLRRILGLDNSDRPNRKTFSRDEFRAACKKKRIQ